MNSQMPDVPPLAVEEFAWYNETNEDKFGGSFMDNKKMLQVFLGSWAALLFLMTLTGVGELGVEQEIIAAGVLAALITLLAWVAVRGERGKRSMRLHVPNSAEVRYRVDGDWIYEGAAEAACWYIKRNAVYGFQNMTPLYRFKNGEIFREGESEPFLRVVDDKVLSCADGSVVYEIK